MGTTTTIEVSRETWRQLNHRKEPGESFDDVIGALMTAEIREFESAEDEPSLSEWGEADGDQECANFIPDRGPCEDSADYVLTMEYKGNEKEVPYCEKHANLPGGSDA